MQTLPSIILTYLQPFRNLFLTNKTFLKFSLLVVGSLLCHKARTVCAALKVLGLKGETAFTKYHNVLNRSKWKVLEGGKVLLEQIDTNQEEPLKIVIDGHLERRKGEKILAKGHYRDPVQSSKTYTVISSGLKWLCVMTLKKFPWSQRTLALPFLTVLVPSEEGNIKLKKRHKTLQDWSCQIIMQIRRWFPKRRIILTADNEFATAEIAITSSKQRVAFVSRLKFNARLFNFPFRNRMGRPRNKGNRLPSITTLLSDSSLVWENIEVSWYGGTRKDVLYYTGTCLWHVMTYSATPIPIRYVLIKDPKGLFNPVLLMSTDQELTVAQIIETYVERWSIEVTFMEAREHLGIETQRQWSKDAIARTTPLLFGLYSLVIAIGTRLMEMGQINVEQTAWYTKDGVKFSDILRGIRKYLIEKMYFCKEVFLQESLQKSDTEFINRVIDLFLHAA